MIKEYFIVLYWGTGLIALGLFFCLYFISKAKNSTFKKLFYIPARKSKTNAIQLGGLPLSIATLIGITFVMFDNHNSVIFGIGDIKVFKAWIASAGVLICYGYLDDRFELRPTIKLFSQLFCVLVYAVTTSYLVYREYSALAFVIIGFWSIGVLNGSNLLDGLDTLTFKLSSVTFFAYFALAKMLEVEKLFILIAVMHAPLAVFYLFNKEPAKMHLGEIGGSFMGLCFLLLSTTMFQHLKYNSDYTIIESALISLAPLTLPMVELGISFLRRIFNKTSPFRGDRFHIHHILMNYHKFSPSFASTVHSMIYMANAVAAILIGKYINIYMGFFAIIVGLTISYFSIGKKHWKGRDTIDLSPRSLFQSLRKKDVIIIDSSHIDQFEFEIIGDDEEEESSIDEDDLDKAA